MKGAFLGFTLLLHVILNGLDIPFILSIAVKMGMTRGMLSFLIAAAIVAVFMWKSRLSGRVIYPLRGVHLMTAGIALYAIATVVFSGFIYLFSKISPAGSFYYALIGAAAGAQYATPIIYLSAALLVVGSFRVLTNTLQEDR